MLFFLNIKFYYNWEINVVDIILNLIIVIITTGLTYLLLTYIPKYKRMKTLKKDFFLLKDCVLDDLLSNAVEISKTYSTFDEEIKDKNRTIYSYQINIKDWEGFCWRFENYLNCQGVLDGFINRKSFLPLLCFMGNDDEKFMIIYSKLSELIDWADSLMLDRDDGDIKLIVSNRKLLKNKEMNQKLRFAVDKVEIIIKLSEEILFYINKFN